jgi:plastocyanin domain-containing protein
MNRLSPSVAALASLLVLVAAAAGCGTTSAGGGAGPANPSATAANPRSPAAQQISIGFGPNGYDPATVPAEAGRPIELTVDQGFGCAAGFFLPELDVFADNTAGPATVELEPLEPGTYSFTCGMQMLRGSLVVTP